MRLVLPHEPEPLPIIRYYMHREICILKVNGTENAVRLHSVDHIFDGLYLKMDMGDMLI